MGFAKKNADRLKVKVVKVTQEWDASVAMTEQSLQKVQCVPG